MVVSQYALSSAPLVVAGLLIKSLLAIQIVDLPFDPESLVQAEVDLDAVKYPRGATQVAFINEVEDRLNQIPDVETAAACSRLFEWPRVRVAADGTDYGSEELWPTAYRQWISERFFDLFENGILQGRSFSRTDTPEAARVAIVNTNFAAIHWPGETPIGKRFRAGRNEASWLTVVGIAADLQPEGPYDRNDGSGFYLPFSQEPDNKLTILLRGRENTGKLISHARRTVADIDSNIPVYYAQTVAQWLGLWFGKEKRVATLVGTTALLALVLAGIGIFGMVSFDATQRRHELATRIAVGAAPGDILKRFHGDTLRQVIAGLVLGGALSIGLARYIGNLLHEVSPYDAVVYGCVFATLTTSALLAVTIPARRAARLDPAPLLNAQ
jgi:predicted permease